MTDYKAIADAVLPGEDYETAFARMSAETVEESVTGPVYETEVSIMSRLGVTVADAILSKIEAAVPARVSRLIQSERGININDPQTKGMLASLVAGSVLTQEESDQLLEPLTVVRPKWPDLKPGYVQNAIDWRAEGII